MTDTPRPPEPLTADSERTLRMVAAGDWHDTTFVKSIQFGQLRRLLATLDAARDARESLHPDDGHDHWYACIRCGVDNGINDATLDAARAAPLDVERLARAIQETILTSIDKYMGPGMGAYRKPWDQLTKREQRHVRQDAYALIAALASGSAPAEPKP